MEDKIILEKKKRFSYLILLWGLMTAFCFLEKPICMILTPIVLGAIIPLEQKDANFKKALLENYDIDGDKKFTENDAINIGTLEISDYQIESLAGIENFKNLYSINAYDNCISDISQVMGLKMLEYANFYGNNITDITCLKNRKFKFKKSSQKRCCSNVSNISYQR